VSGQLEVCMRKHKPPCINGPNNLDKKRRS